MPFDKLPKKIILVNAVWEYEITISDEYIDSIVKYALDDGLSLQGAMKKRCGGRHKVKSQRSMLRMISRFSQKIRLGCRAALRTMTLRSMMLHSKEN